MNISEAYGISGENFSDFSDYSEYSDYSSEFSELDENYGEDFGEARRPRGKRNMKPIAPNPAKSAYQPKPNQSPVTQAQLQAALAKVSQQMNASTAAVKAVDARVRSTAAETERTGIALRKEIADRKKEVLAVRKDLQSTREMAAFMPLLGTLGGGQMAALAPLMMLSQDVSGSTEGGASSGGGMFSGPMGLITIMALSGGLGGGK
jgi:hypothetical protein